jgi:uncharacterized protein
MHSDVAIFPLSTVLFPGGVLPLRIFEARYLDMIRDCMQRELPFGVCLITHGGETGEAAEHEPVGCLASIRGWDMKQLGLLEIRTIGTGRFRVLDRRVARDGLIRATIDPLADDPRLPVPDDFGPCVALIRRIATELEQREPDPEQRMIAQPYDLESASWVSNRLCEFLPISGKAKQKLMELDDPLARLAVAHRYLQQHQVI